ncbi:MAG: branched-chain amino acid aminotransferase [Antricoccus sp.]
MSTSFDLTRSTAPASDATRREILASPGFGKFFTDHMAIARWSVKDDWYDRAVQPLKPFSMHPSAAVLHYAQEIFEGLKAYRHADGSIWLFRPELNAARFARSAQRLAMPVLPETDFIASIEALVRADQAWVPTATGEESLYLRPFMFASEAFLGVRPAQEYIYSVIASPAGSYFASGVSGISLWMSTTYTRAAVGGTGAAKCGGNYAGTLVAQLEAQQHGCEQVLYLDQAGENLEESGTMNLCVVTADGQLRTPSLGTILEGVTRASVLEVGAKYGLRPVEEPITMAQLRDGCANGSITEVFASGTAAVVTPIVKFIGAHEQFTVGDGAPGAVTIAIRGHVLDLQFGRISDPNGWLRRVL